MDSQFNVVFTGELKPGTERETFIKAFSQRFRCPEEKAAEVFDTDKPVLMKSSVDKGAAEKFKTLLEALGMTITLQPISEEKASPSAPAEQEPSSANPYETPTADLQQGPTNEQMSGPVSVPFGHGLRWIGAAFSNHFRANPGAWIVAFIIFAIISMVAQLIPIIGPLAFALLSPVFTAGFMLGCRAQDEGEEFTVGHLFNGFKQSTGQLVLLGLLYLIGTIVILVVTGGMLGSSMAMFMPMDQANPAAAEAMMNPLTVMVPMLVMMALFVPLLMAYWFAPALVVLDGISALPAMKMSFSGCIRNIMPFLLYGIVMFVVLIIATLPLLLGLLVAAPVMFASLYTAYRDIYYPEA